MNHHLAVAVRELKRTYSFGISGGQAADNGSENKIIHGDSLDALKSLLPQYEGRVKCIYLDPPYNTGNEGWVYNDNVNDPHIQKWLGDVVGKEGEDFSRHDKWLCMMYPRLKLLHKLVAEDGIVFISIDDTEQAHLRLILDEIFGSSNFLASIAWEKRYTRSNNAKMFYSLKDTILCYRKSPVLQILKEARTEKADSNYANPDNDPRGPWMTSSYVNPATKDKRKNLVYDIISPDGRVITHPTHAWKYSREEHLKHVAENRLWWGSDGSAIYPRLKNFKSEMPRMVPVDIWKYQDTGTTDDGGNTLKAIFGSMVFDTPKPVSLIERIIKMIPDDDAIFLDCFAGSGTTAHAVLKANAEDGGNRHFILVEMCDYAESVTAERVKRVIKGYGEGKNAVAGTGGDFSFYEIGEPILAGDEPNPAASDAAIRDYVWFSETRTGRAGRSDEDVASPLEPALLGVHFGTAYYYWHDANEPVILNRSLLHTIKTKAEAYVIYADLCALGTAELEKFHITFKKVSRDIVRI